MNLESQVIAALRPQVAGIVLGTIFLFVGIAAIGMAALRRRAGVPLLLWFGVFSGLYGARMLAQAPAAFALLPSVLWPTRPYVIAVITYVILVPALLFWLEYSVGIFRKFVLGLLVLAGALAVTATIGVLVERIPYLFIQANSIVAILMLLVLGCVNAVPSLGRRYLNEPSRVLATGSLVLAVVALLTNLGTFLPLPNFGNVEPIAFGVFVFSLGYVAAQRLSSNERRLLSIDKELEIAREIQRSILPASLPQIARLRISAAYLPMSSVAGDFYEFIHLDEHRAGFLVADVSGHGVPAALIASMVKVAVHSVTASAAAPDEVMRGLNQILSNQLRGQFVTAAYLYLDLAAGRARYSSAGHPPMLYWRAADGRLESVVSNGLLFGVVKQAEYPESDFEIQRGDRFVLYTDGLIEAENDVGKAFGDRLRELAYELSSRSANELSSSVLDELRAWRATGSNQQDDITLLVIDLI
jgi:sigma-B regulation protein RsbU (phosphoserine phosphatase)